jgi:hypothetical protein
LITELKNNKAPGEDKIMGEIIKYGGDKLWDLIYELITNIWKQEEMPKKWLIALIHSIHKKNDKTNCSNYRGISLLNMTYKVMANIIARGSFHTQKNFYMTTNTDSGKTYPQPTIFLY